MKKINQFAIIFSVSVITLIILLYLLNLLYSQQTSSNFTANMMNHMVGGMMGNMGSAPAVPFYLSFLTPVFTILLLIGFVGLIYFIIVPEIGMSSQITSNINTAVSTDLLKNEKIITIQKTMKPDEKKILETLSSHDGKYLQKHISKEANLSRLKTHRIIAGLVQRGIVTVKPYGNTNEVSISDWLLTEKK